MIWVPAAIFAVTFTASAILVGVVRAHALKKNIVDLPNARSSHSRPTPRGGGIAIVLSFLSALVALCFFRIIDARTAAILILAGGTIAGIGYLDDRRQLTAKLRLTVHVAVAALVVAQLGGIPQAELARWGLGNFWIGSVFSVLVLAWGTNLFNFMDGIDGIAASEALFMAAAMGGLGWLDGRDFGMTVAMVSFAAASLGCLVWNWPPARIFMGDVGSGFLGFMLTALAIVACQRGSFPIEVLPILGGVFLVDATVTLLRRLVRGDRWLEAHRMHAYQHLARRWRKHRPVTLLVVAINLLWLLPWAYIANRFPAHARTCLAAALLPLVILTLSGGAGRPEERL